MRVQSTLRRAMARMVRVNGTDLTFYRITYAADDDPRDTTAQHSYTTHVCRGTFEPKERLNEPDGGAPMLGGATVNGGVACVPTRKLGFVPSQADVVGVGDFFYRIVRVDDIAGVLYRLQLDGPAPNPIIVAEADVTPPVITPVSLVGGTLSFTFSATTNENAEYRIRYQVPALTGQTVTGLWTGVFSTSHAGSESGLPASGQCNVEMQARDAAGNTSAWKDLGTVTVAPQVQG